MSNLLEFTNIEDLRAFADAQHKTIVQISKRITSLEEENSHLKKLLEGSVQLIKSEEDEKYNSLISKCDEETIAKIQLNKLKEKAFSHELTLEESRKVDIYSKILLSLKEKGAIPAESRSLDPAELLKLVSSLEE